MDDEALWKRRFLVFTLVRLAGLAIFFLGIAIIYTDLLREGGWPQVGAIIAVMGVIGLMGAMVINLFLQSPAMTMAISAIGVLLFAGLTAYDTQKIKSMYAHIAGSDMMGKAAIMSALTLYLDFINMFQFLLAFMGDRR